MANLPTLTIAIPTFNRRNAVIRNLRHLQQSSLPPGIKILVIDNGSEDGSYESLLEEHNADITKVLMHPVNVGFAKNLISLFAECETEYLLITSDEDFVITKGLLLYLEFLKKTDANFVSPQFFRNEKLYRGKSKKEKIPVEEFHQSSFYLSGLTYKKSTFLLEALELVDVFINKKNAKALLYPQIILTQLLLLDGKCHYYGAPLCKKVYQLKTSIHDGENKPFSGVASRWNQYLGHIDIFLDILNSKNFEDKHEQITYMINAHLISLYGLMATSMNHECNTISGIGLCLAGRRQKAKIITKDNKYCIEIFSQKDKLAEPTVEKYDPGSDKITTETTNLVIIDNYNRLIKDPKLKKLNQTHSTFVISFDPNGETENPYQFIDESKLEYHANTMLGNGDIATLYICKDQDFSGTLPPVFTEQIPASIGAKLEVVNHKQVVTIALDSIEGINQIDAIILAPRDDIQAILNHGKKALDKTLILEVGVSEPISHERQLSKTQITKLAISYGFRFLRETQWVGSEQDDIKEQKLIFIPNVKRYTQIRDARRETLAVLLSNLYDLTLPRTL